MPQYLRSIRQLAITAWVVAIATITGCGQSRSVESFCETYQNEKTAYLERYGGGVTSTGDDLTDVFNGILTLGSAMGDVIIIFEKLADVAPDEIAPDVEAIHESLERQRDSAGSLDPIEILGTGLTSAIMTGGSWQRVSDYIALNCEQP